MSIECTARPGFPPFAQFANFQLSLLTLGSVVAIAMWPQKEKAKETVVDQSIKGPKPGDKDEEFDFQKIIKYVI